MKHLPGFTLIEILLVIALVGIILLGGVTAVLTAKQNQELYLSVENVADTFRIAHTYSRDGKDQIAWGVKSIDLSHYALITKDDEGLVTIKNTYNLPSSVTFNKSFDVPFIKGTGATETDTSITLTNRNKQSVSIQVTQPGTVSVVQ